MPSSLLMLKKIYMLGEYTTNEERINNLIKVTYKSILGEKKNSITYTI